MSDENTVPVVDHYEIRTIEDLYRIPPDKLDHCLADVKASIETHRAFAKMSRTKLKPLNKIHWIDDGRHDIVVSVVGGKQS
jgi:hypothetical protein